MIRYAAQSLDANKALSTHKEIPVFIFEINEAALIIGQKVGHVIDLITERRRKVVNICKSIPLNAITQRWRRHEYKVRSTNT